MTDHSFVVGQHVHRIEDREVTGATILAIVEYDSTDTCLEIAYDEGGSGWWLTQHITTDEAMQNQNENET
jgi:hypothetical protein